MKSSKISFSILSGCCFLIINAFGINNKILFEENKTQWPSQVKYKAGVDAGTSLFIEKNKFTYVMYNTYQLDEIHELSHTLKNKNKSGLINVHAFSMEFVNSNETVQIKTENKQPNYSNYFIGADQSKWSTNVGLYEKIIYENIYHGVNIIAYQYQENFKYDFVVARNANPDQIQMKFTGAENLSIDNNRLIIKTSVGDIIENTPYTYQVINNSKKEVKCLYQLSQDRKTVSFVFPNGYDINYELIIDPVLVGSTYSGSASSSKIFAHSTTYDASGNIYSGGECFSVGYPTTLGAYQINYSGNVDIVISKLNSNASGLIWATYIGGASSLEIPNSLYVSSSANELYILGATESIDYPTTSGCYDNSFNGGSDIIITHLDPNGNSLLGSTYLGGSNSDGAGLNSLGMNMHDAMRGEIIVDAQGNAWIASFTNSSDFPTSTNSYDKTLNGTNTFDACIFRLCPYLKCLQWSTFIGGSNDDVAYGLRLNSLNELYVTGFTSSNNFPVTSNVYSQNYNGGKSDGFVVKFNSSGTSLLSSTFIGTAQDDISYFLDLDVNSNPYIYGCSTGSMPVSAGVYANPGSGNFISKFNSNLSSLSFSTVFGDGSKYYLEPVAFMVDKCENIYLSGFHANSSYPVTQNALYTSQPSFMDNCYFLVLSTNATSLLYGSFYFGSHIDGGTSRFDSKGTIYQGICIGGGNIATTTSWAWDNGANAPFWDMFTVKIAFQFTGITTSATINPSPTICAGETLSFTNSSINAINYIWNFGDGSSTNTSVSPTHQYTNPGTYNVSLIGIDSFGCVFADTTQFIITVLALPSINLGRDTLLCPNQSIILDAGAGATSYLWSNGSTSQTINVNEADTYSVTITDQYCKNKDEITISFVQPLKLENPVSICAVNSYTLDAGANASSYLWSTGATTQKIDVEQGGEYWVMADVRGCKLTDTISLEGKLGDGIIYLPNSFTPDGNGLNDNFMLKGADVTYYEMTIFNRFGQQIFSSNDKNIGWDGTYKGEIVNLDVYVWKLKYKTACTNDLLNEKMGHVTVLK